jgi:FkbM family methyltransferase
MMTELSHHELVTQFPPFQGQADEGMYLDFLGVRTRVNWWSLADASAYPRRFERTSYPPFDQQYLEWIDVLTAVREARERFEMIELGAGWGEWIVRGAVALRRSSNLPCRLVAVEAEPTHFQWVREHLKDNAIDPRQHVLLEAAVGPKDGHVHFLTGNPDGWYGQSMIPQAGEPGGPPREGLRTRLKKLAGRLLGRRENLGVEARRVKCISLNSLLRRSQRVDLIHADIQGCEADVFEAAAAELDRKARLVHVGTHSREVEGRLRRLFTSLEWNPRFDYPSASDSPTPWGVMRFNDGVQSWQNPRL